MFRAATDYSKIIMPISVIYGYRHDYSGLLSRIFGKKTPKGALHKARDMGRIESPCVTAVALNWYVCLAVPRTAFPDSRRYHPAVSRVRKSSCKAGIHR